MKCKRALLQESLGQSKLWQSLGDTGLLLCCCYGLIRLHLGFKKAFLIFGDMLGVRGKLVTAFQI